MGDSRLMFYHRCNFCGTEKAQFKGLEELSKLLKKYRFPYSIKNFETLSYKYYNCTRCNSADRDRLYRLYLERYYFPDQKNVSIVEFAPAEPIRKWLQSLDYVEYRSADLYMKDVDDKVDITDMQNYSDSTFDFFICSHVLEHVDDDHKALSELHRILKPGGKGILMVPTISKNGAFDEDINEDRVEERWRRFGQYDHLRIYDPTEFKRRLLSSNFTAKKYGFRELGFFSFLRNGIRLKSVLYVVQKQKDA
jgi:SAM-dependent methyltransferase